MKVINGSIKYDKYEKRQRFSLAGAVMNITSLEARRRQNAHLHRIIYEATYVVQGTVEIQDGKNGNWYPFAQGQMVEFEPGKFHNMRAALDSDTVSGPRYIAITATFKWISPSMFKHKPSREDVDILLGNDWFGEEDGENERREPKLFEAIKRVTGEETQQVLAWVKQARENPTRKQNPVPDT